MQHDGYAAGAGGNAYLHPWQSAASYDDQLVEQPRDDSELEGGTDTDSGISSVSQFSLHDRPLLSAELLEEMQHVFSTSTSDNDGHLRIPEVRPMMRSLGFNPSEGFLEAVREYHGPDGVIGFLDFYEICCEELYQADDAEHLMMIECLDIDRRVADDTNSLGEGEWHRRDRPIEYHGDLRIWADAEVSRSPRARRNAFAYRRPPRHAASSACAVL